MSPLKKHLEQMRNAFKPPVDLVQMPRDLQEMGVDIVQRNEDFGKRLREEPIPVLYAEDDVREKAKYESLDKRIQQFHSDFGIDVRFVLAGYLSEAQPVYTVCPWELVIDIFGAPFIVPMQNPRDAEIYLHGLHAGLMIRTTEAPETEDA